MKHIIVVGGSLAGHQTAKCLRDLGYAGDLTVYGAEAHGPYDRYPLSKSYLTGELHRSGLDIEPRDLDVDWELGRRATGLDLAGRRVTIDNREQARFDGLVVATGSRPRVNIAGHGATRGVHALRSIEDSATLKAALVADGGRRLVVVGGGLIGAEVASVASAAGHHTTLVDSSPIPTARALGPTAARHVSDLHEARGVRLLTGARVRGLDVHADHVNGVVLRNGDRLAADLVVLATGTRPNVEWLDGSGLDASCDGLRCRATLHAYGSDLVVGAGDVVDAPHPALDGASVRVEHWASTRHQARVAAANLLAGPDHASSQSELPSFGTTLHGAAIRAVGFPAKADDDEVVWGSIQDGEAVVAMRRHGRLIAAVAVNAADKLKLLVDPWSEQISAQRAGRSSRWSSTVRG